MTDLQATAAECLWQLVIAAAPNMHLRKCNGCGNLALHVSDLLPFMQCRKCGSILTERSSMPINLKTGRIEE